MEHEEEATISTLDQGHWMRTRWAKPDGHSFYLFIHFWSCSQHVEIPGPGGRTLGTTAATTPDP